VLKGYSPVMGMKLTLSNCQSIQFLAIELKESVLRYTLAHRHLEAVIRFEYSDGLYNGFLQVNACVDNMRLHVVKLGFNESDDMDFANERHFSSRIRVWIRPEVGATYVAGVSLGRSTNNEEKEVEVQKTVKGRFKKSKAPRTRTRNWRWDQGTEGNTTIFDAVFYDDVTSLKVATWKPPVAGGGKLGHNFENRYIGLSRPLTKTGGLVFAGDEYGEGVGWRLSKEMEGSVLKWRIGGQVWVSYFPNEVKSSYFETRCVEWCDEVFFFEVDLPFDSQ